jgi:hypothetical protein
MVCDKCAALPEELRKHPAPSAVQVAVNWRALAALVCRRCGASRRVPDSTGLLLDTLIRLDRVGMAAGAPPLLENCGASAAGTAA